VKTREPNIIIIITTTTTIIIIVTPCIIVLLEKPTGSQIVKKFPAFYGTGRFITAFTSARPPPVSILSQLNPVQTPTSYFTKCILYIFRS
jgi:hypothetical protein